VREAHEKFFFAYIYPFFYLHLAYLTNYIDIVFPTPIFGALRAHIHTPIYFHTPITCALRAHIYTYSLARHYIRSHYTYFLCASRTRNRYNENVLLHPYCMCATRTYTSTLTLRLTYRNPNPNPLITLNRYIFFPNPLSHLS